MSLIVLFVMVHIIGAVSTLIIHCKNGTMEAASKYGDGVRLAKPSDVIWADCAIWEVLWLMKMVDNVDYYINKKVKSVLNSRKE